MNHQLSIGLDLPALSSTDTCDRRRKSENHHSSRERNPALHSPDLPRTVLALSEPAAWSLNTKVGFSPNPPEKRRLQLQWFQQLIAAH